LVLQNNNFKDYHEKIKKKQSDLFVQYSVQLFEFTQALISQTCVICGVAC